VLLDAAHNAQGAAALGDYLTQTQEGDHCLLFGALGDKDVGAVLPVLAVGASRVILTAPDSPRATRPDALKALVTGRPVATYEDVGEALEAALSAPEGRVVICGSIYLIGDVRRRLRHRFGRPPAAVDIDLSSG
jgi:dihydrofolate synthase/folylpolyglutamate synthase